MQKIKLKFNSQVCTTIEQSKKLLELGLKPETADMYHTTYYDANDNNNSARYTCVRHRRLPLLSQDIPAWSLHRLMEIAEVSVEVSGLFVRISSTYYYVEKDNVYDNLIDAISELINNEVFNKEYLKQ